MSERITDATKLTVGSVVVVAVRGTDRKTNMPYWWRRFVWVNEIISSNYFHGITLKLELDADCYRNIDVERDVVTPVEEHAIPQGVSAMIVKHIAKGSFNVAF